MQAELEEAAEGQVADQEGGELVAAGRIHVAVGVALLDVAPIEVVVLLVEARSLADHLQFRIALEDAPLLAVRAEVGDRYARGDAGGAMLAVRTIEMVAAAAEATSDSEAYSCVSMGWLGSRNRVVACSSGR